MARGGINFDGKTFHKINEYTKGKSGKKEKVGCGSLERETALRFRKDKPKEIMTHNEDELYMTDGKKNDRHIENMESYIFMPATSVE